MKYAMRRYVLGFGLAVAGLFWNGEIWPTADRGLTSTAAASWAPGSADASRPQRS